MIQSIKVLINCTMISDWDRIPVTIEYDHQRKERQTLYHPHIPEYNEITQILYDSKDITDLLSNDEIDQAYNALQFALDEQKRDSIDYINDDVA